MKQRIALAIEYDGTDYFGWQQNVDEPTVQSKVERAISVVANHSVSVIAAGRTDAGVHASGQLIHFDTEVMREPRNWILGCNSNLPKDISVLWAQIVDNDFHARFSARLRRYRYTILNRPIRAAIGKNFVTWERLPLNADWMHNAAQSLIGARDFTSFRTVHCQSPSPVRTIREISVKRLDQHIVVEIEANAFLHHMVRNIVGSLLLVGRGEQPVEWIANLLALRDRARAAPTAPPNGLCFIGPKYPVKWKLPENFTTNDIAD